MGKLEEFYLRYPEPVRGCLFALRDIILGVSDEIVHERRFQIPFFVYRGWRLAFLQVFGKRIMFSIVFDHRLQAEQKGKKRRDGMGVTLMLNADEDLPIEKIRSSLRWQMEYYDNLEVL